MKQRIITAVIVLLLFLPIVYIGGWAFNLLVYFVATIGLMELLMMRKSAKYIVPFILTAGLLWVLLYPDQQLLAGTYNKIDITLIAVLLLLSYTVLVKNKFTFEDAGFHVLSAIYIGSGLYYIMLTRDAGLEYVAYGILIVLATDTGAYFFGRAFGRHKLWPEISPNKTIEGAVGGVILACVVAVIFYLFVPLPTSLGVLLVVTALASIVGQVGDLVESAFKRHYNVKDSGKIFPGHGGVLDRFDSWLFVFPLLHFIHFIS